MHVSNCLMLQFNAGKKVQHDRLCKHTFTGDSVDPWTQAQTILKETREGCNFCGSTFLKSTAEDSFGRIESIPGVNFRTIEFGEKF